MDFDNPFDNKRESPQISLMPYTNFSDGWNPDAVLDLVANSELVEAKNCMPNSRGGISKRPGTRWLSEKYNDDPIKRVFEVGKPGKSYFINASGTTLRKEDGTVITDTLDNCDLDYEVWGDKTYFINGNSYDVWDYTDYKKVTCSESGADLDPIHKCKYIKQRGARMFAAGNPDDPNKVYYSEVNNPAFFKGLNSVIAVTDDDDIITGLAVVGDGETSSLMAFKRRAIYAWYGWDPATDVKWHKQPASSGTISQRTIVQVGSFVYFMGEFGVYRIYYAGPGQLVFDSISDPKPDRPGISSVLKTLVNKENACAVLYQNRYYMLAVQDDDTAPGNNKVLIFDTALDRWIGWFDIAVSDWCLRTDEVLSFGSPLGGVVYEYGVTWDDVDINGNTVPIHFYAKTKDFDLGYKYNDKKIKLFFIAGKQYDLLSSDVIVTIKTDYNIKKYRINFDETMVDGEGAWDQARWGWIDTVTQMVKGIQQRGKRTHVIFENNELGQPLTIYGICFGVRVKKAKGSQLRVTELEVFQ